MSPTSLSTTAECARSRTMHRSQTPLPARVSGFKSRLRHHSNRCQTPFGPGLSAVIAVRYNERGGSSAEPNTMSSRAVLPARPRWSGAAAFGGSSSVIELTCIHCGTTFSRPQFQHDSNLRRGRAGPFCSKACANLVRPPTRRPMTLAEFWSKVDTSGDCWVWTAARNRQGYGHFKRDGKWVKATRWIYEQATGPIPPGHDIRHGCDNPPCVRPSHLSTGTDLDNSRDRVERGRARGWPKGVKRCQT
jgi:hypothetical protein